MYLCRSYETGDTLAAALCTLLILCVEFSLVPVAKQIYVAYD